MKHVKYIFIFTDSNLTFSEQKMIKKHRNLKPERISEN